MKLRVHFRRRTGSRRILRFGTHIGRGREFRLALIDDYNKKNKRVIRIEEVQ